MKLKKITDNDHSNKYIKEYNKLTSQKVDARIAQANLASKNDIVALAKKKTDFDNKLKNLNKKFALNKTKPAEAEKKITDLTNKVAQILEKGYDFLLGTMHFTGNHVCQNFLIFAQMLSYLTLHSNKKSY